MIRFQEGFPTSLLAKHLLSSCFPALLISFRFSAPLSETMKFLVWPLILCIAFSLIILTYYASEVKHWSPSNAANSFIDRKRIQPELVIQTELPQNAARTDYTQSELSYLTEPIDSRMEDDPRQEATMPATVSSRKPAHRKLALNGFGPRRSTEAAVPGKTSR